MTGFAYRTSVATVLDQAERSRIDAATGDRVSTIHARSVGELIRAVREGAVNVVLVSPKRVSERELPDLARFVREFPEVPMAAVLSRHDAVASRRLFELGQSGIRSFLDISQREGLNRLRDFVGQGMNRPAARMLVKILEALDKPSLETRRFFEALVILAPGTMRASRMARLFGVVPSTLTSRFYRAALPSPKRYISAARLLHAAAMLEVPGLSIADVSNRLAYSSPQSFSRHIRGQTGLTCGEFRRRMPFAKTLDDFITHLILPYRATFATFHPFDLGMAELGQSEGPSWEPGRQDPGRSPVSRRRW